MTNLNTPVFSDPVKRNDPVGMKKVGNNSVGTVQFNYKMTGDVKIYCYFPVSFSVVNTEPGTTSNLRNKVH